MADKTYINDITIKSRETNFGDILKVSFKADGFAKFLSEHANEKGYVNIEIMPRKEVSEYGHTHYAVLDTWKPDSSKSGSTKPATSKPTSKPAPVASSNEVADDEIPF